MAHCVPRTTHRLAHIRIRNSSLEDALEQVAAAGYHDQVYQFVGISEQESRDAKKDARGTLYKISIIKVKL